MDDYYSSLYLQYDLSGSINVNNIRIRNKIFSQFSNICLYWALTNA